MEKFKNSTLTLDVENDRTTLSGLDSLQDFNLGLERQEWSNGFL